MEISKSTLTFLSQLAKNNTKEWFDANRNTYQTARAEFINFVDEWINEFSKTDIGLKQIEAKNCIFRINKDIRFSKDKTPYKTNFGAYLSKGGKKSIYAGYYLHIEPKNCFFATGIYVPMPNELAKVRQEIDYNFEEFKAIILNKKFKATLGNIEEDGKLKKAPKGYDDNNEAIEYLKLKSFLFSKNFDDNEVYNNNFSQQLIELSKLSKPLVDFFNRALD